MFSLHLGLHSVFCMTSSLCIAAFYYYMELFTALPKNNNCLTTTALEAARNNGLSNKPVVHEQTLYHTLIVPNEPAKSLHNSYTNYI